ncbi:hypothetical protein [Streptomyces sp. NPDC001601]|uniref:hypothetical protein n=1 Tax=unclassified Streptomyces TaxID=2593676 RepID=UPI0036BDBC93
MRVRLRYEPTDPVVRAVFFVHSDDPVEWALVPRDTESGHIDWDVELAHLLARG